MPVHPLTKRVWYSDPVAAGDRPVLGIAAGERASLLIDGGNTTSAASGSTTQKRGSSGFLI